MSKTPTNIVTLVRRRSGFTNVADSFEVMTDDRRIDELNEQADTYDLPAGYTVAESQIGTLEIYDQQGDHCSIVEHSSGRPQLVSLANKAPVLQISAC